jgi:hypothetical protein
MSSIPDVKIEREKTYPSQLLHKKVLKCFIGKNKVMGSGSESEYPSVIFMSSGGSMQTHKSDMIASQMSGTCAPEFDPGAVSPDVLDEDDEFANQLYEPIDAMVPDGTIWQEVSPGYQAEAGNIEYQEPPQSLDEIACCRYGIQICNGPYTRLQLAERMDWEKAMHIMGEEDRQVQDK